MGIGPFDSFSFPGIYTRTLNEAPTATAAGQLRFPAFVGVADEVIPVNNYEMIRGSSSLADNPIVKEDVSDQFDGSNRDFNVTFFPVVSGNGTGTTTTDPKNVVVYVNDEPVPVSSVDGETGLINLVQIPAMGDEVLASYYFQRDDTHHTDEDLSEQADGTNKTLTVFYRPIVQGDNGGITTTDPTKVSVKVNNVISVVTAVDGDSGQILMDVAPASGATVEVTYYSNEWQNTYDVLPSSRVASIEKVGYSPGTADFVSEVDFVLDTTGDFNTIQWGQSSKVTYGTHSITTNYFLDQITDTLFDNRNFKRPTTGTADGTNEEFGIEQVTVTGQGLAIETDDPSLITAYVGTDPSDATTEVNVVSLDALGKTITLQDPPAAGQSVFVTQYMNTLPDDSWTLTNTVAGAAGVGTYTVLGESSGVAMDTLWSTADTTVSGFLKSLVEYPAGSGDGNADIQVIPSLAVEELVTVTFTDSTDNAVKYIVTSDNPNGSGSAGDNTGYLNQTYIDGKTGFRVTLVTAGAGNYVTGDIIGYNVSSTFETSSVPTRGIPGVKVVVTDTEGVGVGDTATIKTYNKGGAEPSVGDFYYVSFEETKKFNSEGMTEPVFYTQEKDVIAATGPLSINNKLGMAAHLSFLNGAPAVALLQVLKTTGSDDAPDSRYIAGIDVFDEPMSGGVRPSLMEPVTTSISVLAYLKTSNVIQSGIRYANERITYFGFPLNTSPSSAQTYARSMNSERMIGIYPDGAVTTITDYLGNEVEYLVDGALLAAAISGRDTSPAFDVATPLTRKPVVGFKRLYRRMDSITSAQTANAGLTILEEQAAGITIKFDVTTDLSSVLTRTPSVIRIKDFVQKGSRSVLDTYIGTKFLATRTKEIETTLSSYLNALQGAQIISAFTGVKATVDPNDPTIVNVEAFYSPVFPLLWIVITFNLRSSI